MMFKTSTPLFNLYIFLLFINKLNRNKWLFSTNLNIFLKQWMTKVIGRNLYEKQNIYHSKYVPIYFIII